MQTYQNQYRYHIKFKMGQSSNGQAMPAGQYTILRELPNGSIVRQLNNGRLHFLKQYSFTNQEAYQQAFVNFSKKLPEKHQHILYLERTNTKLENTFCSTFYKISLLYEYFDHSLQREIQQRNEQRKVFDEKEVWSVLCSCALGVSEMIRVQGRSHAALSTKDIRLNEEGLVKIISLEMVGMDSDHDLGKEGTTKQLAITILNCLLMEQITNDSQDFLLEMVQNLQSTVEMKNILRLMLNPSTKFVELEQYLFRMVQQQTDSLNSYSNTPNLKEKPVKHANSYSKIQQQSKQDDSLMSLTRDMQDAIDNLPEQLKTVEEQIPDQNDIVDDTTKIDQSQPSSVRQKNSGPASYRKSKCQSPTHHINLTSNQNSLFTDPKLLNLIHSDLEQIKKRKSIAGSRKLGISESTQNIEHRTETKVLQNISNNIAPNILAESKNSVNCIVQPSKSEEQLCQFKLVNLPSANSMSNISLNKQSNTQGSSNVRVNSNNSRVSHKQDSKTQVNIRLQKDENHSKSQKQISEGCSNPQKKLAQKKYDNIMDIQDMGFKKNKVSRQKQQEKQQSRVSINNISNSNVASTVVYNSNVSSSFNSNTLPMNGYQSQKSKQSQQISNHQNRDTKTELQYVTQTYIRGRYQGTKFNSMRHGKGVFYYNQGGKYIGEWKQNKMNGKGVLYYPNNEIAYDGEWKQDQLWGRGTLYNEEVTQLNSPFDYRNWDHVDQFWLKYEGQFSEDSKNGQGKLYLSNGQIFQGNFKDDMVWGQGILLRRDGSRLKGLWRQNKLVRIY